MPVKTNLRDLSFARQNELVAAIGEPSYRAGQLREWLYQKKCASIDDMTNIPGAMRSRLSEEYSIDVGEVTARQVSSDDTIKYLIGMADGMSVETVLIPEGSRKTVCVSTQVGCRYGCLFCATGTQGFSRDLTSGEITGQILVARADAGEVTNVVFMGMGEPLDNLPAVLTAIEALNSPEGFGIGVRRITVSTAGVVPAIEELSERGAGVNLAVSLHSADEDVRSRLMPINKKYPLDDLLAACRAFRLGPYRKLTFEVALFDGVNDSPEDARKLAKALRGNRCTVNLLTFNPIDQPDLRASGDESAREFRSILEQAHIAATHRRSRGADINAACGQLRVRGEQSSEPVL